MTLRVQKFGMRIRLSEEEVRGPKSRGWVMKVVKADRRWLAVCARTRDEHFADDTGSRRWITEVMAFTFTRRGAWRKINRAKRRFEKKEVH